MGGYAPALRVAIVFHDAEGLKVMNYYRVFLDGGKTHRRWADWYNAVYGDLGAPAVDWASDNLRVVKTAMNEDQLLKFCSTPARGKSFAADVEVEEITRANVLSDPHFAACLGTIQRYYNDFLDLPTADE